MFESKRSLSFFSRAIDIVAAVALEFLFSLGTLLKI